MGVAAIEPAAAETAWGGSVLAEVFGLEGFEVLVAADARGELEIMVQTRRARWGCSGCGAVATTKDRRPTWVADLRAWRPELLAHFTGGLVSNGPTEA